MRFNKIFLFAAAMASSAFASSFQDQLIFDELVFRKYPDLEKAIQSVGHLLSAADVSVLNKSMFSMGKILMSDEETHRRNMEQSQGYRQRIINTIAEIRSRTPKAASGRGGVAGGGGSHANADPPIMASIGKRATTEGSLSGSDEEMTPHMGLGYFDSSQFSHIAVIPDVHGDAEYFIHSLWLAFQKIEPHDSRRVKVMQLKKLFYGQIRAVADSVEFPSGNPSLEPLPPILSTLGNRVALIQLGDIMDRGPQSLYSYKILASIEPAIGWKVVQLAGNHDLMIYNPSLQASPEIPKYPYFARGFDLRYNRRPTDISNSDAEIMFSPGGPLSDYIIRKDLIVARIGTPLSVGDSEYVIDPRSPDTLFVHAGLDLIWANDFLKNIEKRGDWTQLVSLLNQQERASFERDLANAGSLANDDEGPLFVRKIPEADDIDGTAECPRLEYLMKRLHVSRVIVGHTPDREGHTTREYCGSRFVVTDVAMSRGMSTNGQPYALLLTLGNEGRSLDSMVAHYDHPMASGRKGDQTLLPLP